MTVMMAGELPTWRHKLLALQHELLYPAFLGAALFEFAKKIIEDFPNINLLWLSSGSWFVLYFSVAFLSLAEAKPEKFGGKSFFANLLEIGVILKAVVSISLIAPAADHNSQHAVHCPQLNYTGIYLSWILIPITALASNFWSDRTVRTAISIAAVLLGIIGLCSGQTSYPFLLFLMYLLLAVYYIIALVDPKINFLGLDYNPR
jgi:hypothetical protein